jgi:hypothetical protein
MPARGLPVRVRFVGDAITYRIQHDPRLPSDNKAPGERRRPGPLVDVFEAEVVPRLMSGQLPRK